MICPNYEVLAISKTCSTHQFRLFPPSIQWPIPRFSWPSSERKSQLRHWLQFLYNVQWIYNRNMMIFCLLLRNYKSLNILYMIYSYNLIAYIEDNFANRYVLIYPSANRLGGLVIQQVCVNILFSTIFHSLFRIKVIYQDEQYVSWNIPSRCPSSHSIIGSAL